MITFVNKVDGSVFTAEPGTVQYDVFANSENYEVKEQKQEEKAAPKKTGK